MEKNKIELKKGDCQELMKKILSSKFRDFQSFTDKETNIKYQTMTLETWDYLIKIYDIEV